MTEYDRSGSRELLGLVIILIGFGLLMNSLNILPFGPIVARFWLPSMFLGLGILLLARSRDGRGLGGGIFFVLFGALFFMSQLNLWDFHFRHIIGPTILIWIGLSLLLRRSHPRRFPPRYPRQPGSFRMDQTTDSSDFIHATAVLGGFNRKCSSQQFRGGDFTAIMGGGKIDLRDAQTQGNEAVIDVFTVMGGMEIQVPMDWVVEQRFTPILGGFDDKTRKAPGNSKRLVIHGTTIMGGISVTN